MDKTRSKESKTLPIRQLATSLQRLLFGAHFSEAREFVAGINFEKLRQAGGRHDDEDFVVELRLRCMAAEVLDYWGQFEGARKVIEAYAADCQKELELLRDGISPGQLIEQKRHLMRQRIWVLLHAGVSSYRSGHLRDAMELFKLSDTCLSHVTNSTYPAWGTRARTQYCIGLVHRERSDYEAAQLAFTKSVEYAYLSLGAKNNRKLSELTYVAISKSLALGLAFIHNTLGRPDLAFPLLLSAKSILQPMGEHLISSYVDLIYANTVRSKPGDSTVSLTEVISQLQRCYDTFKEFHHSLYLARTAYSLGLAYIQRARPDETIPLGETGDLDLVEASKYIQDIGSYAESSGDKRFGLYRYVLKSRIYRKRDELQKAVTAASVVLDVAQPSEGIFVDAAISRGEAFERNGNVKSAIGDFEKVLSVTKNPRHRAISLLHLVCLYARMEYDERASRSMSEFYAMKSSVTHVQIEQLESRAKTALKQRRGDFVLAMTDEDLKADQVFRRLRAFLVAWARNNSKNDTQAKDLLGISKQTFYKWAERRK